MGRYSLKIKLEDIELNFDTQDVSRVANQVDKYFGMMLDAEPRAVEPKVEPKETILSISPSVGESFGDVLTKVQNIDEELPLTLFMQRKISNSLFDDFIITAFFLKNVLNQESFTIKSLNLNLYSASNKIVDFEILNEALKCEYVKVVATEDANEPTRYTIASGGEGYYNKLQDA